MNYNSVEFMMSVGLASQLPENDKTEIVFAGKSNVGKSSMINKIFNRKNLARVSSVPGKTITINYFSLENLYFVDLPGYGYAKASFSEKERWSKLIEAFFAADRDIGLVLSLIDIRHPASCDDIDMINYLIQTELPFIIVFTKSDKLNMKQRNFRLNNFKNQIPEFDKIKHIVFSSETGEGVEELKNIFNEISEDS